MGNRPLVLPNSKRKLAFTAVCTENAFGIGVAERDEPGYFPMPEHGSFPTFNDAMAKAAELNRMIGVSDDEAAAIVGSSMAAQNVQNRRRP